MIQNSTLHPRPSVLPFWLPPLLIVLVVLLGYGIAPARLPLVGEETCRANHGREMVASGDWVIPTQQGVPWLDRPPLQYWTLAAIHKWVHELDPLTLRVSMVVVTLLTALLIWWYARRVLTETGAFIAAVAYPTMGHVFDLGRRVETDGQFTLLLAGALLVWHAGYAGRWRPAWTWSLSAILAAAAALTKGTQAPVAYFGAVYLFLLLRRDWRYFLQWGHALGVILFFGLIAIWQVPFFLQTGMEGTRECWLAPGASRVGGNVLGLLVHLVEFPVNVFVSSLPWSPLLAALFDRRFWRMEEQPRSAVVFMLVGMAAIFVPVWLSADGHHRYIMPMYPLMAVVCGAVAQRCLQVDMEYGLRRFWRDYVRILAVVVLGIAAVFLVATVGARFSDAAWMQTMAQPWWLLLLLVAAALVAATVMLRLAKSGRPERGLLVGFVLAAYLGVAFNGAIMHATASRAAAIGPEVQALRQQLPEAVTLVSFGPLHHKFVYWYEAAIPILPRPTGPGDVPDDLDWFAINAYRDKPLDLPFAWEEIARFNMDRTVKDDPREWVVVARRIRDTG
jgi:4-amino-4-deoxy-L-arabinose transferase-like glycosyltransferase